MRRGEVWLMNLDPFVGREQAGTQPAIVLSRDDFNLSRAELVSVVPMTTRERDWHSRVRVEPGESGLSATSWAICEQIRTVSKARAIRRIGAVTPERLGEVAKRVAFLLDLR